MVKNLESAYVPNERKDNWIKLKPEYIDGVGDDLDLIILGGYYGTGIGRRGGTISHFMLGVIGERDDCIGSTTYGKPTKFYSFCKVGSGYTDNELRVLQKMLEKHWKPFNPKNPPSCFELQDGKERPDVWIHPKNSKIVQVKAAQIVVTEKYRAGYTLRFPRVMKLRSDKSISDCLDLSQLLEITKEFEGRYAKRKYGGNYAQPKKRARTQASRTERTVVAQFQEADVNNVAIQQNLFQGLEFCVMSGDNKHSKSDIERVIYQLGGARVQYPNPRTFCVIAGRENLKLKNIIKSKILDVVNSKWVFDCLEKKKKLPFEPKYMIFTCQKTKTKFLEEIDKYGDSFTQPTTVEKLKEAFFQVEKEKENREKEISNEEMQNNNPTYDKIERLFGRKTKKENSKKSQQALKELEKYPEELHQEVLDLQKKTVAKLKELLKEQGFKISGRKAILIQRLIFSRHMDLFGEDAEIEIHRKTTKRRKIKKNEKGDGQSDSSSDVEENGNDVDGADDSKSNKIDNRNDDDTDDESTEDVNKNDTKVADQKDELEIEAKDITNLERKCFLNTRPWWDLFRDNLLYFDLYLEIGNEDTKVPFSGLEVSLSLASFYGGKIATKW
eukprot:CAMPEP_0174278718 /NCGR_PEP_ID=MMETSP0439-20130205/61635_1 /TAXON_ID=0 /ORGANISM="Stereomyxa ramosa, Strain Chinc5" /LENGTH=611 /DNA_ID=CAMNT_0015371163 /DNA_START=565 /DNA_END=2397 /DNA_ORIENTATION=+